MAFKKDVQSANLSTRKETETLGVNSGTNV
jgi:hypothetical protein